MSNNIRGPIWFGLSNAVVYLTDANIITNYISIVFTPNPPSEFFKQYGVMTNNVIGIGILPAGKQTFQVADPGSLLLSPPPASSSKAIKVPVKKYNNTNKAVQQYKIMHIK